MIKAIIYTLIQIYNLCISHLLEQPCALLLGLFGPCCYFFHNLASLVQEVSVTKSSVFFFFHRPRYLQQMGETSFIQGISTDQTDRHGDYSQRSGSGTLRPTFCRVHTITVMLLCAILTTWRDHIKPGFVWLIFSLSTRLPLLQTGSHVNKFLPSMNCFIQQ